VQTPITLRALRHHQGLSIDELSKRSKIERSRLSRAERGYVELRDEEVKRIASLLGVAQRLLTIDGSQAQTT
jgi:transcriptional regulator with XRE-family HTH domain